MARDVLSMASLLADQQELQLFGAWALSSVWSFGNHSSSVYPKQIRMPVNLSCLIIFVHTHVHITLHRYSVHRLLFVIQVLWAHVNDHIYLYVLIIQRSQLLIHSKRTKMLHLVYSRHLFNCGDVLISPPHLWPICLFLLCLISKQSSETALAFCDGSRRPIWDAFLPANPT